MLGDGARVSVQSSYNGPHRRRRRRRGAYRVGRPFGNLAAARHDYYASTAVWYTDDGPRLQTRHWQMTIRCHNCGYADAEKEHTFPVRLELPEGCSVLVCRNLRVIGSAPVAV